MRTARTLFAAAAATAILSFGAPVAIAATPTQWTPDSGSSSSGDSGKYSGSTEHGQSEHGQKDPSWGGDNDSWSGKEPHGGVHAGGGGLAVTGSGLAAGTVLLVGGLGAGAYMLRRRTTSGSALA
ncbi:hypothetical protein AB0M87_02140 [Streptomyces sp. NPDC051320]|uniref:hypothetical protein n=1 Tax=Streptomyces sp. NPDC051320 TaxID=3154644 RepID=UPI003413BCDD